MKNSAKLLAGVGLGLVMGTIPFLATGCSNIELTQEQVDKIMTVVENGDTFMKESIDVIEETNDILKNGNKELTREDAWHMFKITEARFTTNYNNFLDNFKMVSSSNYSDEIYLMQSYRNSNNKLVYFQYADEKEDRGTLFIENNTGYYWYNKNGSNPNNTEPDFFKVEDKDIVQSLGFANLLSFFTLDDLHSVEIQENGNIKLSFTHIQDSEYQGYDKQFCFSECEITSDYKFVNYEKYYYEYILPKQYPNSEIKYEKYEFKYGEADVDLLNDNYNTAMEYINSHS